jgi:hypothetical protein
MPDFRDATVLAQEIGVLLDDDVAERCSPKRRAVARRRDNLREVTDEEARYGLPGRSRPCSRAVSSASS